MDSFRSVLKSLKDTLLEYAVLNMDLSFPNQSARLVVDSDNAVSHPLCPRYLFEEILVKSEDMCWSISERQLKSCVAIKDRLRWCETSIFRFVDEIRPCDLHLFRLPLLKTLKVKVSLDELKNLFSSISSDTLEDLEITVHVSDRFPNKHSTENIANNVPLKLKRFSLHIPIALESLPCNLDSDKLTILELEFIVLTRRFIEFALIGFKRLVRLSLRFLVLHEASLADVVDAIVSLEDLRILTIVECLTPVDELTLHKITENMTNLDILELDEIEIRMPSGLLAPKRKLKALNYLSSNTVSPLTGLAHRIGNLSNVEGIMNILSTTPTLSLYFKSVRALFELIQDTDMCPKLLIEAEKTGNFNFRSSKRLTKTGMLGDASYNVISRLVCYGRDDKLLKRKHFLKDWIKDFVERNGNTHLAKRLMK